MSKQTTEAHPDLEVVATIEVMSYDEETTSIETRSDRINFDNALHDDALVFKSDADRVISGFKYKAELYDEVWSKAKALGYMNVTMALDEVEKLKTLQSEPRHVFPTLAGPENEFSTHSPEIAS